MLRASPFIISSYLVSLSAAFILLQTGITDFRVTIAFLLLSSLSFFLEGTRYQLNEKLGTGLALILLPMSLILWKFGLSASGIHNVPALLGIVLHAVILIKLFQKKVNRDWIFVYLISFFAVLLASIAEVDFRFVFLCLIHLVITTGGLLLMEMRRGGSKVSPRPDRLLGLGRTGVVAAILGSAVVIVSLPLFFALPRIGSSAIGQSLSTMTNRSGFSETVELGTRGRIQLDDTVVMRAMIEGEVSSEDIKWRGVALDYFDHKVWSVSSRRPPVRVSKTSAGRFQVKPSEGKKKGLITQDIYRESMDGSVLFTLSEALAIRGEFPEIQIDSEGAYRVPRNGDGRLKYQVISHVDDLGSDRLRMDMEGYSKEFERYLQLPSGLDPAIARLTSEIVSKAEAGNRYDSAVAIEAYLQGNFGYTLDLKSTGDQPLRDFLFNIKEGHCEYFASAMAIMLRTQGIATRVVNGFQSGELNASTGMVVVRKRDAHSWVEVYFPSENRWVEFDPTPPSSRRALGESGFANQLRWFGDTLETLWIRYFVSFDEVGQASLASLVLERIREGKMILERVAFTSTSTVGVYIERLAAMQPAGKRALLTAIVTLILFALLGLTLFLRKVKRFPFSSSDRYSSRTPPKFYEELTSILRRQGHLRKPSQTPLEFAVGTGVSEVVELTRIYNEMRFRGTVPDEITWKRVISLLRDLRKSVNTS